MEGSHVSNQRLPDLCEGQTTGGVLPELVDDEVAVLLVDPRVPGGSAPVKELRQLPPLPLVDLVPLEPACKQERQPGTLRSRPEDPNPNLREKEGREGGRIFKGYRKCWGWSRDRGGGRLPSSASWRSQPGRAGTGCTGWSVMKGAR